MAEIRVEEKKRGLGWLWALIALIIVALLIWFFMAGAEDEIEPVEPVGVDPGVTYLQPVGAGQPRIAA